MAYLYKKHTNWDLLKKESHFADKEGNLSSLVCRKDIINGINYPLASYHPKTRQLLVGAAINTFEGIWNV